MERLDAQEELADKAGISLSFLGHIERGSRIPSVETLAQICRALHADMNAIAWGEAYRRTAEGAAPFELSEAGAADG